MPQSSEARQSFALAGSALFPGARSEMSWFTGWTEIPPHLTAMKAEGLVCDSLGLRGPGS
jgi:hypothetical protein